ncbi:MAG: hypothetical protein D6681_22840 [Calditrichaeota bacterium]|nr:MAG: hypothetical protein D6681_22840 [Calditrichota bacterium]
MSMLVFYRTPECPQCKRIQEILEEMVIAHRVVSGASGGDSQTSSVAVSPPAIVEGNTVVQGHREILRYLEALEQFKAEWDKFQSDACYCGDDGEIL